jgi:hypothetical protein
MFRLPNKHPIFNRSVLGSVFLFSAAVFVPWVLAESLPNRPQPKTSSSTPSPQSESLPQPSPDPLAAEREWHQRIVSQSLSWQRNPDTATSTTASKTSQPKTNTPQSQSTVPQTNTNTSQPSNPVAKAQAPESSKTSNQQKSKSHSSTKSKAKASHSSHTMPAIEMRVAIANGESSLTIGTSTPGEILNARGKALGKLSANEATSVVPNGSNIRIGKWETPTGVWVKPTNGGFVFVGNRWYRGDLLLVSQGSTLLAVNYVELESYIASVVGCEVSPSWPMDALKAQAIAARSYALVHYLRPANALYNLGNTQRWQVYRGINSEWNTTRQAAEETKGVFLSYKGGVVESLYAADDKIVTNVHGGRGMSQNGALNMAQQGYNYQQILSKYYPGASLAWMDTQQSDTH